MKNRPYRFTNKRVRWEVGMVKSQSAHCTKKNILKWNIILIHKIKYENILISLWKLTSYYLLDGYKKNLNWQIQNWKFKFMKTQLTNETSMDDWQQQSKATKENERKEKSQTQQRVHTNIWNTNVNTHTQRTHAQRENQQMVIVLGCLSVWHRGSGKNAM